jgi:tetratricopeptide (TPR) repeat protein/TolB-like protein
VKELTIPSPPRSTRRARTRPSLKTLGWLLGGLMLLVAGVALSGTLARHRPPRGIDPRRSLLIGFFDNTRRDASLEWLRLGGVELLSRSLARWQDLDVVPPERLLDLTRGARLSETAPMTQAEAQRLAREAGVWTASVGSILPERDSIQITLRLYDVASGRQLRQVSVAAAGDSALPAAFATLADQIFDLARVPDAALIETDPPTRSIVAWKAYVGGLWHSTHGRTDSATILFHQARLADPGFALAYLQEAVLLAGGDGPFNQDTTFLTLADSAWKYATGRPEKERLRLQAFWHLFKGRFPEARASYAELLRRDSLRADAWSWAGVAANFDRTLRRAADGRLVYAADPTFALRAYRRALALDRNYGPYFMLTLLLNEFADSGTHRDPAYARPPSSVMPQFLNDPARWYCWILVGDSVIVTPADSFKARPSQLQDSRTAAETALRETVDRWLEAAPDYSEAWWWRARALERERRWNDALTAYTRADRLGYGARSWGTAYDRLSVLLGAHRLQDAARLADSLPVDSAALRHPGRGFGFPAAAVANAWMAGGRVREARALTRQADLIAGRAFNWLDDVKEYHAALDTLSEFSPVVQDEGAASPDLPRFEARLRRLLSHTTDSLRPRLSESAFATFGLLAAQLGDTAWLRRWRSENRLPSRFSGLDAWARARAHDRSGAAQALSVMNQDNSPPWPGNWFAAGRAAELLGNPQQALGLYAMVDSTSPSVAADWILVVRSWKARADVYRVIGDTAKARIFYQRVIVTWVHPDPLLVAERDDAARRLAELEGTDRRDR